MTLNADVYKLIETDPKKVNDWVNGVTSIRRNIKEQLILFYLFNRNKVNDTFILEEKAPACPNSTKFLCNLANRLYDHFLNVEDIHQDLLVEFKKAEAKNAGITFEKAEQVIKKYENYFIFLVNKNSRIVVSNKQIEEVKRLCKDLEGKYATSLRTQYYNKFKQEEQLPSKEPFKSIVYNLDGVYDRTVTCAPLNNDGCMYRHRTIRSYNKELDITLESYIDMLEIDPERNEIRIGLIRIIDTPLTEITVNNPFWFDIGISHTILTAISKVNNCDLIYTVFAIDPKGYSLKIHVTNQTRDKYHKKFQSILKEYAHIFKNYKFNNYPEFVSEAITI